MMNEPNQYNYIGSNNKKENNDNGDNSKRKHLAFGDDVIDDFYYKDMVKKARSLSQVPYSRNSPFECTDINNLDEEECQDGCSNFFNIIRSAKKSRCCDVDDSTLNEEGNEFDWNRSTCSHMGRCDGQDSDSARNDSNDSRSNINRNSDDNSR